MKAAVTVFLSLLLLWTQSVYPAGTAQKNPKACASCCCESCNGVECCPASNAPETPAPAAPVRNISQDNAPLLLLAVLSTVKLPFADHAIDLPPSSALLKHSVVPIYQQNCTFLI